MIISGFPCIGKSSVSGRDNYIDLESSMFFSNGVRPNNWEEIYINIAEDLSKQGYDVFVSSHKSVREEMIKRGIVFYSIYPNISLKDKWEERLLNRYNQYPTEKNKRAMDYIITHFEESVADMSNDQNHIEIDYYPFNLLNVIKENL